MPRIAANGSEFEYDEIGPADGPPLVLVMGFTAQMTRWPDSFRRSLAEEGFRVIRFDNRDIGLSRQFDELGMPDTPGIAEKLAKGQDPVPLAPYLLDDMAADLAGIIDALDAGPAHILGASMGGMIVQLAALNHPDKVRSVIPVMTTSGDPGLPRATPEAMAVLTAQPESTAKQHVVAQGLTAQKVIGSHPDIRDSDDALTERLAADYDRAYRPMGIARQYAAILAQPRWHDRLSGLKAPVMVLHGEIDPLIPAACGKDVADRVPEADYVEIPNWGHDVPSGLVPTLAGHTARFCKRVDA